MSKTAEEFSAALVNASHEVGVYAMKSTGTLEGAILALRMAADGLETVLRLEGPPERLAEFERIAAVCRRSSEHATGVAHAKRQARSVSGGGDA